MTANGPRSDPRPDDRPDDDVRWGAFDETLADEPLAEDPPDAARAWLAEQRCVHGLLRAMHGADAQAAELRVQRILAATVEPPPLRWRWTMVAAAALLLCLVAGWLTWPERLPAAEAAIARGVSLLAQDVDRRFVLTNTRIDPKGRERMRQEFALTARPGMHFLVEGTLTAGALQLGSIEIGCDGEEVWLVGGPRGQWRRSAPLAEADRLLGSAGDVLDLGYLDVHALVQRLPSWFELRTVGRERGPDGTALLRIQAHGQPRRPGVSLLRAELWCDEATGMITRVAIEAQGPRGARQRTDFEYEGTVEPGQASYRKPW